MEFRGRIPRAFVKIGIDLQGLKRTAISSGVHSYTSTLDRLTYTNVELRLVLWNFEAEFLEPSLKLG